jgi:hypothetical protein
MVEVLMKVERGEVASIVEPNAQPLRKHVAIESLAPL